MKGWLSEGERERIFILVWRGKNQYRKVKQMINGTQKNQLNF